jgi:FkbM family methyltransferase
MNAAAQDRGSRLPVHRPALQRAARAVMRRAWEWCEAHLDHSWGRPVLLLISRAAIAGRYRQACRVGWAGGIWEYRWPDSVVLSDRPLVVQARPDEVGRLPGRGLADDFLWGYTPAEGDVVFDLGAGIGEQLYTLVRLVGPQGRVFAFEPHPLIFRLLERLCEANGWTNVELIQAAVADRSGTATLTDDRLSMSNDIFRPGRFEVPCVTLHEVVERYGLTRIDLLKMNVEGAEVLALKGLGESASIVRHLSISCHDFLDRDEMRTKLSVVEWLRSHGFVVRDHPDPWHIAIASFTYASRPAVN